MLRPMFYKNVSFSPIRLILFIIIIIITAANIICILLWYYMYLSHYYCTKVACSDLVSLAYGTSKMCSYHSIVGAGLAQSVQCLTTDWTTRVQAPAEAKDFSSSLCVQTSFETHLVSYSMGTEVPFQGQSMVGA
jgi:hypothetical protein